MPKLRFKEATKRLVGGKTKKRSQMCLVGTDDGRIVELELDVKRGCAVNDATTDAFLLDDANQFRNKETGHWYQPLGERSTLPLMLMTDDYEEKLKTLGALIDSIFEESIEEEQANVFRPVKENLWLFLLVGGTVLAAVIRFFIR